MSLINRHDAIEAIFKVGHEHLMENVLPLGAVLDYSEAIKALPIVDAVEVVRCKDCIHYESDGGAMMICNITDMVGDDDDYCSYGERKTEEKGEAE